MLYDLFYVFLLVSLRHQYEIRTMGYSEKNIEHKLVLLEMDMCKIYNWFVRRCFSSIDLARLSYLDLLCFTLILA